MTQPPAGWFPDPSDPSRQRYFDGKQWTNHYAAPAPPPSPVTQQSKPGMSTGKKIAVGVGGAVAALILISNLGGGDKEGETKSSSASSAKHSASSTTSTATYSGKTPAPAGSAVRDGKFEFQVLGVERGKTSIDDAFGPEIAKGEFFIVKLRITNIGDEARRFSATNQKLIVNGNKYEATSILDDSWLEEINPGLGIEASVAFDIPPGAVPTAIECHDSAFSGGALLAL